MKIYKPARARRERKTKLCLLSGTTSMEIYRIGRSSK